MTSKIAFAMAAAALLISGAAHAQADLAEKAGCNKCHAADTKKMGPSYKDHCAEAQGDSRTPTSLKSSRPDRATRSRPPQMPTLAPS